MKTITLIYGLLLVLSQQLTASERTYVIVTNAAAVNHWPGPDGFIGTADDPVTPQLSKYSGSSPNDTGSYSYIATIFAPHAEPDPFLFGTYDAATFILGSARIDTGVFVTNNVPKLLSLEFSGTELFPGHGPYTARFTNPKGGVYSRQGNAFTVTNRYDFEGTFVGGPARGTNAEASGLFVVLEPAEFDAPDLTIVPENLAYYVRTVAVPLAKNLGAKGLVCGTTNLKTAGAVPGTTGSFPALTAQGFVLAMDFGASVTDLRISGIQVTPEGVRLQWTALTGKTYSVESTGALTSAFTPLAANITQTEYLDTAAKSQSQSARYYRISAQ